MTDNKYYIFLEELRRSNVTNMFGVVPYLLAEFPELKENEAKNILKEWMATYNHHDYK